MVELGGKEEHSRLIFWSKKSRKDLAREEGEMELGSTAGALRESRESKVDQSFLG